MTAALELLQLPIPQPSAFAATGNVPLAAGCLAVAARAHGLAGRLDVRVVPPELTDRLGDTLLAEEIARREPDYLGLSLYLWNSERSLHIAREVKRRSPRTTILIGGPEVSADNPALLAGGGFDVAVTGEAEDVFVDVMRKLLDGREVAGTPGVSLWTGQGATPFAAPPTVDFPLHTYTSPYLDGTVPLDPERSTYLETVRGCRSRCTFCFYPKSSGTLRALDTEQSRALVESLLARGARDLVFLDPTFNHRPDFPALLEALGRANAEGQASCFAEVRAEGLTGAHAAGLAAAGFNRLELGLQSVNVETLRRIQRYGRPEKVAETAALLRAYGIDLLVDLIIGLPGDGPDDVRRGVDFLLQHGLGENAQVFPLALLPGTAMRAQAEQDGVLFDPAPPYRVLRTKAFDEDALRDALFEAERALDRDLDEYPRRHLVDPSREDGLDVVRIDTDGEASPALAAAGEPGAAHVALWILGRDIAAHKPLVSDVLRRRLAVDPFAVLDIVVAPRGPFEVELLRWLRAELDRGVPSYLARSQALRGEDVQRRLCVVLPPDASAPAPWLEDVRRYVPVYREQTLAQATRDAAELGRTLPAARITSPHPDLDPAAWAQLAANADPEAVAFADRRLERRWVDEVLGYRETDRAV